MMAGLLRARLDAGDLAVERVLASAGCFGLAVEEMKTHEEQETKHTETQPWRCADA